MLPPGHIVAGFLVAKGLLAITDPALTTTQTHALLWAGAFFGFVPDLDMFYAFFKAKGFTLPGTKVNHRSYLTHRPMVWLALGIAVSLLSTDPFWQLFGLLIWLGSWSHFILDSLQVGVMWLWPLDNKFYALKNPGEMQNNDRRGFFSYWIRHLTYFYPKEFTSTFVLEIVILILGAVTLVNSL